MKGLALPLIVLGVLVINIWVFALRFSAAHSGGDVPLPAGEGEERRTLSVLAQRIKAAGEEASSLLEKGRQAGYEEEFAELILQGILHNGRSPLALINGRMLGEGDKIEGARVIEIKEREVVLQREEAPFTLKLGR